MKKPGIFVALPLFLLLLASVALAAMPDEEFVDLCYEGEIAQVAQALKEGANPNAVNHRGIPALFGAILQDDTVHRNEVVKMLLDAGADPNIRDGIGSRPLINAAMLRAAGDADEKLVRLLLKAGADVNARDEERGVTALLAASAVFGTPETVKLLLKAGANPNIVAKGGATPLILAVNAGWVEKVDLLLKAGAKVNVADRHGTPLLYAIRSEVVATRSGVEKKERSLVLVPLLLKAGADVNRADENGESPLMAVNVEWLMKRNREEEALSIIRQLLKAGANVNAADKNGKTALMEIACSGSIEALKLLLEAGADVNARDKKGRSTLDRVEKKDPFISCSPPIEAAALLKAAGATPTVQESNRQAQTLSDPSRHSSQREVIKIGR